MKLVIKEEFKDKNTGVMYKKGDVVDFESKRAKELFENAPNLVEKNDVRTSQTSKVDTKPNTKGQ